MIDYTECQPLALAADVLAERMAIFYARLTEALGECDRVAVEIQNECREAIGSDRSEAERGGENHACGRVDGFELAVDHLVADRRPAHFAAQFHVQAVLLKKPQLVGHHYGRAVRESYESQS